MHHLQMRERPCMHARPSTHQHPSLTTHYYHSPSSLTHTRHSHPSTDSHLRSVQPRCAAATPATSGFWREGCLRRRTHTHKWTGMQVRGRRGLHVHPHGVLRCMCCNCALSSTSSWMRGRLMVLLMCVCVRRRSGAHMDSPPGAGQRSCRGRAGLDSSPVSADRGPAAKVKVQRGANARFEGCAGQGRGRCRPGDGPGLAAGRAPGVRCVLACASDFSEVAVLSSRGC